MRGVGKRAAKARPPDGGARPVAASHLGATQERVVLDWCARRTTSLATIVGNPRLGAAPGAGERDHATAREQLDQRLDVARDVLASRLAGGDGGSGIAALVTAQV